MQCVDCFVLNCKLILLKVYISQAWSSFLQAFCEMVFELLGLDEQRGTQKDATIMVFYLSIDKPNEMFQLTCWSEL